MMNKRQAKKREKLLQLGMDWGFYHFPTYREIKKLGRGYHEYCVRSYRTEKETKRVLIGGEWF